MVIVQAIHIGGLLLYQNPVVDLKPKITFHVKKEKNVCIFYMFHRDIATLCKFSIAFAMNDSSIKKFFPIDSVINQMFRYDHIFQMDVVKRLASFFIFFYVIRFMHML